MIDKEKIIKELKETLDSLDITNKYRLNIIRAIEYLQEEPVREVWHDASKEPNDMSHCLIFYGDKNDVGHYLHYEPVLYNHQEKVFVTESFPHPTGYKVEQKSIDGGCVAEVYKNKRDRISISDITQWCYLKDLHNLSNIERTVKDWKEEPIIEVLDRYLDRVPDEEVLKTKIAINEWFNVYFPKLQEEPVSEGLEEAYEKYTDERLKIIRPDIYDSSYSRNTKMTFDLFEGYELETAFEEGAACGSA